MASVPLGEASAAEAEARAVRNGGITDTVAISSDRFVLDILPVDVERAAPLKEVARVGLKSVFCASFDDKENEALSISAKPP